MNHGYLKSQYVSVSTTPYTVLSSDEILLVDSSSAAITVNLPAAADNDKRRLTIKDAGGQAGTNNITVDPNGAETIDGETTYLLDTNYESIDVVCDGTGWYIT